MLGTEYRVNVSSVIFDTIHFFKKKYDKSFFLVVQGLFFLCLHLKCWFPPLFLHYTLFLGHLLLCHPVATFLRNAHIQTRLLVCVLDSPSPSHNCQPGSSSAISQLLRSPCPV